MRVIPTRVVRGRKNPTHWKFPQRLRRARKLAGLSGSALSLAAGVGRNSVTTMEDGARLPRLPMLERIAGALKISPGYLAFGLVSTCEPGTGELRCAGLAARARQARVDLGLSVRDVEQRAEDADGILRAVESGTMPTLDTLEKLAGALGVSPAWLAFGEGPRELPGRRRRKPAGSGAALDHAKAGARPLLT